MVERFEDAGEGLEMEARESLPGLRSETLKLRPSGGSHGTNRNRSVRWFPADGLPHTLRRSSTSAPRRSLPGEPPAFC